jgi:hypothetical protein
MREAAVMVIFWSFQVIIHEIQAASTVSINSVYQACSQNATISFVLSVCPHRTIWLRWTEFHEIRYMSTFKKSVKEIQVSFKYEKNNGYFTYRPINISDHISLNSS